MHTAMLLAGWQPLASLVTQVPTACMGCGVVSARRPPVGWHFRSVPVRGEGRHGRKVRYERLCPSCSGVGS